MKKEAENHSELKKKERFNATGTLVKSETDIATFLQQNCLTIKIKIK